MTNPLDRLNSKVKIHDEESYYDGQIGTVTQVSVKDEEVIYIIETNDPHGDVKMQVRIGCIESELEFLD